MSQTEPDFTAEIATYARVLPTLLPEREGWYVGIVGDRVFGPFASAGDAWRAGLPFRPDGNVFVREVRAGPRVVMLPAWLRSAP